MLRGTLLHAMTRQNYCVAVASGDCFIDTIDYRTIRFSHCWRAD